MDFLCSTKLNLLSNMLDGNRMNALIKDVPLFAAVPECGDGLRDVQFIFACEISQKP